MHVLLPEIKPTTALFVLVAVVKMIQLAVARVLCAVCNVVCNVQGAVCKAQCAKHSVEGGVCAINWRLQVKTDRGGP